MPEGNIAPAPAAPERRSRRPARVPLWVWIFVLLVAGILAGLLQPARCKVRESSKRAACKNHLRQIGIALHLYADAHDHAFPPSLAELYPAYADSAGIFSCPSAPSSWKDFEPGGRVTEKSTSYSYIPGLSSAMPGGFVVAHDKSFLNHKVNEGSEGYCTFLLIDGSVERWRGSNEPAFERRLTLQAEAVAKWRASGKPVKDIGEFISPELRAMMGPQTEGDGHAGR